MRRLYPRAREVESGADLEDEYLVTADRHVRANFVITVDGRVELDGRSASLSGEADRAAFLAMRAVADVILVGAGTVRDEHYGPVRVDAAVEGRRRARQQAPAPTLAIVTNRANLDPSARVFTGHTKVLLLTCAAAARQRPDLTAVAEVIACGDESVNLGTAVENLYRRGLGRILCEGGPTLLRGLLNAGLVNEFCCTTAPYLAGPGHRDLLGDQAISGPISLALTAVLEGDGMLLARYQCPPQP
jgi:riboflavin biosynthesis pyrimidine reductase